MPVHIAGAEHTFAEPIGLLSDCHRRIERFLQALITVTTDRKGGSLDAEYRHAMEGALRYFRQAAPKHTQDEEEDLFPRLRDLTSPDAAAVVARVDRLEREHETATAWHGELEELGERWLAHDSLPEPDIARFVGLLTALSDLYRAHIELEEREVFPVAQRELSADDKQAIGQRMAARRGVPFIPEWVRLKAPDAQQAASGAPTLR